MEVALEQKGASREIPTPAREVVQNKSVNANEVDTAG